MWICSTACRTANSQRTKASKVWSWVNPDNNSSTDSITTQSSSAPLMTNDGAWLLYTDSPTTFLKWYGCALQSIFPAELAAASAAEGNLTSLWRQQPMITRYTNEITERQVKSRQNIKLRTVVIFADLRNSILVLSRLWHNRSVSFIAIFWKHQAVVLFKVRTPILWSDVDL